MADLILTTVIPEQHVPDVLDAFTYGFGYQDNVPNPAYVAPSKDNPPTIPNPDFNDQLPIGPGNTQTIPNPDFIDEPATIPNPQPRPNFAKKIFNGQIIRITKRWKNKKYVDSIENQFDDIATN